MSQEKEEVKQLVETQVVKSLENNQTIKSAPLQASEKGLLVGGTFEEQWRIASAYAKSGLVPQALATPEKVLVAMQFARELGLQPITAMRQMCIVNGVPSIWGDLPLSLAMKSGHLEDISEKIESDEKGEPFNAVCAIKRRGINTPVIREFSMDDARRAGLANKTGPWKLYTKRMLQCRARAWALKDLFPDTLSGVAIAEWDFGTMPEEGSNEAATMINSRRSSLNEMFSTKELTADSTSEKK